VKPWTWSDPETGQLLTMPVIPVYADSRVRLDSHRDAWWLRVWRGSLRVACAVRYREGWEAP